MSLLQISVAGQRPELYGSPRELAPTLRHAVAQTNGPICIMVHGFRYAPNSGLSCPHQSLFSNVTRHPSPHVISWPRHLNAGGLTIGLGWQARGTLWAAYREAQEAAFGLATICLRIKKTAPDRPVNIIAHSLGARVALQSLSKLPAHSISNMILLAAAEYRSEATKALETRAGETCEVLHVTSGENQLYDILFQYLISPPARRDRAFGTRRLGHARTLLLDNEATLEGLHRLGFRIGAPSRRICHWSPYLRKGVFALYNALMRNELSAEMLDAVLKPPQPRSTLRLPSKLSLPAPLPLAKDRSV